VSAKKRIDLLLVERGLAPSRERAQALLLSGAVLVNEQKITKSGTTVAEDCEIRLLGADHGYVSRGALKLIAALDAWSVSIKDRVGLDVGASTGGFTQVLLERGARRVHAIDVGHNQLDWKIRSDARVVVKEGVNARYLTAEDLPESVDVIVIDVSFISLAKILPATLAFASADADWVTLIKPQFEAGREHIDKGGIVRSEEVRRRVVEEVKSAGESLGLRSVGLIESPITGSEGNIEYLMHWKRAESTKQS
jgi:23S rRNA (cytidine1920-2'-O)/16S rRNA (cytidine1409-2'-O)-methyltransferase